MCGSEFHDLVDKYFATKDTDYLECIIRLAKAERLVQKSRVERDGLDHFHKRKNAAAARAVNG